MQNKLENAKKEKEELQEMLGHYFQTEKKVKDVLRKNEKEKQFKIEDRKAHEEAVKKMRKD